MVISADNEINLNQAEKEEIDKIRKAIELIYNYENSKNLRKNESIISILNQDNKNENMAWKDILTSLKSAIEAKKIPIKPIDIVSPTQTPTPVTLTATPQVSPSGSEGFKNMCSSSNYSLLSNYDNYKCGPPSTSNFFGNIEFKPECCNSPAGSSYSNSMGCACICPEQWNFLNSRGGNRNCYDAF
jgi:hypothetical protein